MSNRKEILEIIKLMEDYNSVNESTSDSSGSKGSYIAPMMTGLRKFKKTQLAPFDVDVPKRDSYDNEMNTAISKNKNISKPFVSEADSSITAGAYTGPIELGLKKWRKQELGPFTEFSKHPVNKTKKQKTLKNNIKKTVGVWEKHHEDKYEIPTHDVHSINEDLGVWFGTKKKPKGSKQPKGPWVNICRKVDGKHPPCGRPDASDKAYPKCRAAGVAGKMSDSQKKAACAQKRRAEKSNPKSGTGNKPKMVSYKPKKKTNESIIISLIRKAIN